MEQNPIYNFLKENNLTQKDEASFLEEYSNPEKAKELHGFMSENGLTQKDYDSFYGEYLKKKDQPQQPSTESVSEVSESVTEEQPMGGGLDSGELQIDQAVLEQQKQTLADPLQDFDQKKIVKVLGPEVAKKQQQERIRADEEAKVRKEQEKLIADTDPAVIEGSLKAVKENKLKLEVDVISPAKREIDDKLAKIETMREQMGDNYTPEQADEYNALVSDFKASVDAFEPLQAEYESTIQAEKELLDMRQIKRSSQGDWLGAIAKSFVTGGGEVAEGAVRTVVNLALSMPNAIVPENLRDEVKQDVEEKFTSNITKAFESVAELNAAFSGATRSESILDESMALTTPEFVAKKSEGFFGGSVLGVAGSGAAIMTGGAGLIAQASNAGYKAITEADTEGDLSYDERWSYGLGLGIAVGLLEKAGLQTLMNKGAAAKILNKAFDDLVASGQKINSTSLTAKMAEIIQPIARGGAAEFLTGASQESATIISEIAVNAIKDKEIFEQESFMDAMGRIAYAGAQEMVGGMIMSAPSSVVRAASAIMPSQYQAAEAAVKDGGYQDIVDYVQAKVDLGEITPEQASEIVSDTKTFVEVSSEIPESLPAEAKPKAFELVKEKKQLEAEIEGKDPALVQKQIKRIKGEKKEDGTMVDGINQELEKLAETPTRTVETTQDVVVEPEAQLEIDFDTELESATDEQITEINEEYERIKAETDVATTEGEVQVDETAETKEKGAETRRDVRTEIVAQDLPDITQLGTESDIAVTGNVSAKVKVIELPDGETAYAVQIFKDGQLVEDKNGDTEIEFTNDETQQLVDHLNKKQRGFILSKQPKGVKEVAQDPTEIPEGTKIRFSVFGDTKEGVAVKGGGARSTQGRLYVAPMIKNVEVIGKDAQETEQGQQISTEATTETETVAEATQPLGAKPEIKMTFPTNVQLRKAKNLQVAIEQRNRIKEDYKELKGVLDCLWKTIS